MQLQHYVQRPGHHQLLVHLEHVQIEVILSIPEQARYDYFAIVAHPHPLQEGSMHNKVVTTTAKAVLQCQVPVCRFNFRGVGASTGHFDAGVAETQDLLALIQQWQQIFPQAQCLLFGFSFGSFVAYRAAQMIEATAVVLIAPPIFRFDFTLDTVRCPPTVIVMGDQDEIVAPEDVESFAKTFSPPVSIEWLQNCGHFFHGRLLELQSIIATWTRRCLNEN